VHQWWPPQEILHRLRREFADDPMMQVSHETSYQALFVQGRGELRRELARCRNGRIKRPRRHRSAQSGRLRDMVMISERPPQAPDRAVPGHWEGDLIIGKDCRSAVGALVEPTTRHVLLLPLPTGGTPPASATRSARRSPRCPRTRSRASPGTSEVGCHTEFTIATGIPVYF
jgi:transposase, IS30 family